MTLFDRYCEYYKPLLRQFCNTLTEELPIDSFKGIPHPFIPSWGKRYEQSMVKTAIIGLETCGWSPELPEYIGQVKNEQWESSFDMSEFQNLDYVNWSNGTMNRYSFWGFVMYFLASLYGVKNWEILKQRKHADILNCFVWGNACAIERWNSHGIPEGTSPEAHCVARETAQTLNDFQHIQKLFAPQVTIILCSRGDCNAFLRNTDKALLWDRNGVRLWAVDDNLIFNMPHPNNMRWNYGADYYAKTIRTGLEEHGLFQPMQEFLDCDKEAKTILNYFKQCKKYATNTKDAIAFIATELRKQDAKMTVRLLCEILNSLGYHTSYGTEYQAGRGSYRTIACAWRHYQEGLNQPDVAESIALAFTKPNGDYAYWDY